MNETVESIFTQMFAPAEIPQKVKDLYEKVRFYSDRIDQPIMRPLDLVLIAAMATQTNTNLIPQQEKIIAPLVDTSEPEQITETKSDAKLETLETPAPLGVMDVPAVNKPPSEVELQRLTYPELRIYCRDTLGWNPPFQTKADMIKKVVSGEYLKFRKKK
jgi:hypothetical protein